MFIPFASAPRHDSTADRETVVSFVWRERLYFSPGSRKIFPPLSRVARRFSFSPPDPPDPPARAGWRSLRARKKEQPDKSTRRRLDDVPPSPPDRRNPRNHRPSLRHARSRVTAPAIASASLRPDARMQLRRSNLSALLEPVAGRPRRRPRSPPLLSPLVVLPSSSPRWTSLVRGAAKMQTNELKNAVATPRRATARGHRGGQAGSASVSRRFDIVES